MYSLHYYLQNLTSLNQALKSCTFLTTFSRHQCGNQLPLINTFKTHITKGHWSPSISNVTYAIIHQHSQKASSSYDIYSSIFIHPGDQSISIFKVLLFL